jgi:hypothetical protein
VKTFLTHNASAGLVSNILSPINDSYSIASGCQTQGYIIAGWPSAHNNHIIQNGKTSTGHPLFRTLPHDFFAVQENPPLVKGDFPSSLGFNPHPDLPP